VATQPSVSRGAAATQHAGGNQQGNLRVRLFSAAHARAAARATPRRARTLRLLVLVRHAARDTRTRRAVSGKPASSRLSERGGRRCSPLRARASARRASTRGPSRPPRRAQCAVVARRALHRPRLCQAVEQPEEGPARLPDVASSGKPPRRNRLISGVPTAAAAACDSAARRTAAAAVPRQHAASSRSARPAEPPATPRATAAEAAATVRTCEAACRAGRSERGSEQRQRRVSAT
jgi:hypothetical protein